MKSIKILFTAALVSAFALSCSSDDDNATIPVITGGGTTTTAPDFTGTFAQEDQMGRPAINTVFVSDGNKDAFNTTIPSNQNAAYQSNFQTKLLALNTNYTTNALGQDAPTFTGLLATDVLGVSKTGVTTFFDGMNVLTGRALADDVINTELLLIFGGPMGADNPGLTNDNVDSNDKAFLSSFPYLASPF
jgi:hypothetical protein